MENQTFSYNGNAITFQRGAELMVNATEMAKSFGKQPIEWLRYQQSQDYITSLSKLRNHSLADLVEVRRGGDALGTWMHEDVALEFARWLSPEFGIWCNDRIKELLNHGITASDITIEKMVSDPDFAIELLSKLKKERAEKEAAKQMAERLRPKAALADRILDMGNLVDIGQASKILELGFGRNTLFRKLREAGVFFKDRNEPMQSYIERGYFLVKEKMIGTDNGEFAVVKVLVTQKGLQWLAKKFEGITQVNWEKQKVI